MESGEIVIEITEKGTAQSIMDKDASLLESLKEFPRHILHFYSWERPSLTYGYFIDPKKYLNLEELQKAGIAMARRPTGGGIIFHLWDMAFSLLVPKGSPLFNENPIENYKSVHALLLKAMGRLWKDLGRGGLLEESAKAINASAEHFCMATPTKYDLMVKNQKLAGAAQRKTRYGYLHQGTISLATPDYEKLKIWLLGGETLVEEMKKTSFITLDKLIDKLSDGDALFTRLQNHIINEYQQFLSQETYDTIGSS